MILCSGRNTKQDTARPIGPEPLMSLEDQDPVRTWKMLSSVTWAPSIHIGSVRQVLAYVIAGVVQ
jgi:hypothetical protein